MEPTLLLCTDGSESSIDALAAGLAVLGCYHRVVIATVLEPTDPTLVANSRQRPISTCWSSAHQPPASLVRSPHRCAAPVVSQSHVVRPDNRRDRTSRILPVHTCNPDDLSGIDDLVVVVLPHPIA